MAIIDKFKKKKPEEYFQPEPKPKPDTRQSKITPKELANPIPPKVKEDVTYHRGETGEVVGVEFSDGRSFSNISAREAMRLAAGYKRSLEKTRPPVDEPIIVAPPVEEPPPNATPEQLAQIGEPGVDLATDELTESIQQNIASRESPGAKFATQALRVNPLLSFKDFTSTTVSLLNRMSKGGRLGDTVLTAITKNEAVRGYLSDYSNNGNFKTIQSNMVLADDLITTAKSLASFADRADESIEMYHEGLDIKRKSLVQLKLISDNDQEKYVNDAREEMTKLEAYFARMQALDDAYMYDNIKTAKKQAGGVNGQD